jgi:hypothetical protein
MNEYVLALIAFAVMSHGAENRCGKTSERCSYNQRTGRIPAHRSAQTCGHAVQVILFDVGHGCFQLFRRVGCKVIDCSYAVPDRRTHRVERIRRSGSHIIKFPACSPGQGRG